jgi:hypothetical protein
MWGRLMDVAVRDATGMHGGARPTTAKAFQRLQLSDLFCSCQRPGGRANQSAAAAPIWRLFDRRPKKTPRAERKAHHDRREDQRGPLSSSTAIEMSLSCRYAAQCCARQLRASATTSSSLRAASTLQQRIARRNNSTEAAPSPKISAIVEQISQLTLLETADLVASLKVASHPLLPLFP